MNANSNSDVGCLVSDYSSYSPSVDDENSTCNV